MHPFLLFHSLVEIAVATISFGTFLFAWNTRRFQNGYLLTVGAGALFVGLFESLHLLAYPGMSVFPAYGANLSPELWLSARLFQAGASVAGLLLIRRSPRAGWLLGGFAAGFVVLAVLVFAGAFPALVMVPAGLTPFKIAAEWTLATAYLVSAVLLIRFRQRFSPRVLRLLVAQSGAMAVCEICFTLYARPYDPANIAGHVLLVSAGILQYLAILHAGLTDPDETHFRDLAQARDRLERAQAAGSIGTFEWELRGTIATQGMKAVYGDVPDRFTGEYEEWRRLVHPDDIARVEALLDEVVAGRAEYETEYRVFWPDGSAHWVGARGRLQRDEEGRPVRLVGVNMDITGRKLAEEALRESERHYKLLFAANPNPMFLFDEETLRFVAVNDAAVRHYGWTRDEFLQLTLEDVVAEDERGSARERVERFRGATEAAIGVVRHLRKDGAVREMEITVSSVTVGGRSTRLAAMNDITERRRAEEALHRYELVFQQSRDIILFMRRDDGRILEANPAACAAYGYTRGELLSLTLGTLRAPETVQLTETQMNEADAGGMLFETEHRRRDGSTFPAEVSSRGVTVGDTRMLVSVVRDITERHRAAAREHEQRQQAEQRAAELDAILDSLVEPLVVSDAQGTVVRANPAFQRLFGGDEEWLGLDFAERIRRARLQSADGQPADTEHTPGRRALAGETVRGHLQRLPRPDGSVLHLATSSAPIRTAAGVVGAVVVFTDVTERIRAEEALREADHRKNEFLAVLSHELRNPLAPIRNSLYLLGHVPAGGPQATRALQVIDRQVNQLTRLVDDLLEVNRIATGKMQVKRAPLDLVGLVRATVEDHRTAFAQRGIAFDAALPARTVNVVGDAARLAQAVGNLLQNAAKFTPEGGHVELSVRDAGADAVIEVRDTGVGIEAALLEHIFDPFTQADRTLDRSSGGLGLGLALVAGIVALHDGTVHAASEGPGHGAQFTIRLPRVLLSESDVDRLAAGQREVAPRSVLVIEDNGDAAESLRDLLELFGHGVQVAGTGADGLEIFRASRPDIVLCDIGLPVLDGYEVAQRIREMENGSRRAVLVALTGYGMDDDQRRAAAAGFDEHLTKPIAPDVLRRVLARE